MNEDYSCQQHVEYHQTDPAILRVCHQTHDEAAAIFYGNSAFCFGINNTESSPVDVVSFLSALTPVARNSIQTLKLTRINPLSVKERWSNWGWMGLVLSEEDLRVQIRVAAFCKLIAEMKVQRLAIDFDTSGFEIRYLEISSDWIRPVLELGKLSHISQLHLSLSMDMRWGRDVFRHELVHKINAMGEPYSAHCHRR